MERSSFFNAVLNGEAYDRVYLAEDYARYFSSFIGNGVFPTPSTNLQVVANGTTMNIILKGGKGWINGYFYENTDDLTLNVAIADGVLNRIDRVVLRLDFINREIKAYVKKGTFASSPVAPTLIRNSDMYELGLADIRVNKGVTKIVQADITDLRQNNTYCGLVAGVVQQIDTTNLFTQFQSSFDIWFEHMKGQLSTDAAGNLQSQIDILSPLVDSWNDFKSNGGTLFNSLQLKPLSSTVDVINTSKGYLGLNAGSRGVVVDEVANVFRPSSTSQNSMSLGSSNFRFNDIYLNGFSNVGISGYSKEPNGTIKQWGQAIIPVKTLRVQIPLPVAYNEKILGVSITEEYVTSEAPAVYPTFMLSNSKSRFDVYPKLINTNNQPQIEQRFINWETIGI
ncbi:hypothetical protein GCM10008908_24780 [Clostridium subterminale]|uniref:Phage structural protein n=1 Tax=Clostridium subterminale TaxID=1550 RepID=A0ABP3W4I1_CLOSU